MHKFLLPLCGIMVTLCLVTGCASSAPVQAAEPGPGESLVVVQRPSGFFGAAVKYDIYIDGEKKGRVKNGGELTLVVPNGVHVLFGTHPGGAFLLSDYGWFRDPSRGAQTLVLDSVRISYRAYVARAVDRHTLQDVVFVAFEKTGETPLATH